MRLTPMTAGEIGKSVESFARAAMGREPVAPLRSVTIKPGVNANWGLVPDGAGDGGSVG